MTDATSKANEYAQGVAQLLIEQLQQGTAPWQRPWEAGGVRFMPYNPTTGKEYRAGNALYLYAVQARRGYEDTRWMTFRQALGADAHVRKGEKGTGIQFYARGESVQVKDEHGKPVLDANGKAKKTWREYDHPRLMHFTVFNASQIDGLAPPPKREPLNEWERHERAEAILAASGAAIQHLPGDRAFYSLAEDRITLPLRDQFKAPDAYYATALHELGHWTGHPTRLDRDLAHPFGSIPYAKEELRAEIASMMLGERLSIGHDPGQHSAYVGSWIKVLKEDPREIFRAAADAEKIGDYVLALDQQKNQIKPDKDVAQPSDVAAKAAYQKMVGQGVSQTTAAVVAQKLAERIERAAPQKAREPVR